MQQGVISNLAAISDGLLEIFLTTPFAGERLKNPLVRSMHTSLQDEQLRRVCARAGQKTTPVIITIPLMDDREILEAAVALSLDCVQLEHVATVIEASDPAAAVQFRAAADFLCTVGLAVKWMSDHQHGALEGPVN